MPIAKIQSIPTCKFWTPKYLRNVEEKLIKIFFQNLACEECDGFENGHICSNAGDCINNQCQCDGEFMGYSCQLGRKIFLQKYLVLNTYMNYFLKN